MNVTENMKRANDFGHQLEMIDIIKEDRCASPIGGDMCRTPNINARIWQRKRCSFELMPL